MGCALSFLYLICLVAGCGACYCVLKFNSRHLLTACSSHTTIIVGDHPRSSTRMLNGTAPSSTSCTFTIKAERSGRALTIRKVTCRSYCVGTWSYPQLFDSASASSTPSLTITGSTLSATMTSSSNHLSLMYSNNKKCRPALWRPFHRTSYRHSRMYCSVNWAALDVGIRSALRVIIPLEGLAVVCVTVILLCLWSRSIYVKKHAHTKKKTRQPHEAVFQHPGSVSSHPATGSKTTVKHSVALHPMHQTLMTGPDFNKAPPPPHVHTLCKRIEEKSAIASNE